MSADSDARYMFRRAREEAAKADAAERRRASSQEVAVHRELALRYKVRALAMSCPDQVLHDAMEREP
ncbi:MULTISPECIES: hypothetical protein [Sphingobium]|uniref:Uncharacterized protein n=1 Tax=Sphingobium fuliginis (strain ATCC 27551) TaxID=336203 RepID=A0ABQ1EW14_SPHSA|nr:MULTISPECIES: hypothetical protein [Sphingobium]AJR25471.1 hypothetical protein TZ53_18770 [Sphingobium sp. YBL2]RYL98763.1 hypothetical protein EWH10_09705 [Sphingobium fuliginis]UXC91989.1 hypothetical protein EGM87_05805 [Sphingobium sp. RSMS]WDA37571.1 hypothetical protein PO876_05105 [Sphingobium sp. YC-XJ3]GFZ89006.1 hypothetical protein GCM10019071_18510 [Sphingobium fuliginis]